jgi:hypothetical protein
MRQAFVRYTTSYRNLFLDREAKEKRAIGGICFHSKVYRILSGPDSVSGWADAVVVPADRLLRQARQTSKPETRKCRAKAQQGGIGAGPILFG